MKEVAVVTRERLDLGFTESELEAEPTGVTDGLGHGGKRTSPGWGQCCHTAVGKCRMRRAMGSGTLGGDC